MSFALVGYVEMFKTELDEYKDSFTPNRYKWMSHIDKHEGDRDYLMVVHGYLMACEDLGKDIGYLKGYMEYIIDEVTK